MKNIVTTAITSRVVLLLATAISSAILPDFDPGGDVLQFDLRLSSKHSDGYFFCLEGHACDQSPDAGANPNGSYLDGFYRFILPPVTKWDSARFLTLAVDPSARYPNWDAAVVAKDGLLDKTQVTPEQDKAIFHSSEQSHAFLPFFPLCIRHVANALVVLLPRGVLPSTYEATAALSAILINMVAFAIAAVALYELTLCLMQSDQLLKGQRTKSAQKKDREGQSTSIPMKDCETISKLVAMAFCFNPAGVFFTVAYSESIFAMLTFTGHAVAAKGRYLRHEAILHPQDLNKYQYMLAQWYPIPTNILWAFASYTRSNGVISTAAWWVLIGLGSMLLKENDHNSTITHRRYIRCTAGLLHHICMGCIVSLPVLYHDFRGFNSHCMQQSTLLPDWCSYTGRFSLYAYVQHKHWNVGLLRYYELKQIPNFILAAPVLVLSFWAAVRWIQQSLQRHNIALKGSLFSIAVSIYQWAVHALSTSAMISNTEHPNKSKYISTNAEKGDTGLLLGSNLLPYYAILFGFSLIGTFLAHVQISTRLICSSCPALYWFIVRLYLQDDARICSVSIRSLLCFYFSLYNLLGVIMHVNWLPWT